MEEQEKAPRKKQYFPMIIMTIIVGGANIFVWYISKNLDSQIVWIGFTLVWFNLLLSWLTFARQHYISYMFVSTGLIIETMVLVNNYWVATRLM